MLLCFIGSVGLFLCFTIIYWLFLYNNRYIHILNNETIVRRLKGYFFHNVYSEVIKIGIKRGSFHCYETGKKKKWHVTGGISTLM
jgi:hypothetical protein